MQKKYTPIDKLFLHSLLLVGILFSFITLIIDLRNGFNDFVTLTTDFGVFLSLTVSFLILHFFKKHNLSVLCFTISLLSLMMYEMLHFGGYNLGIGITVIIVIGYAYSIMLKGNLRILMHTSTLIVLVLLLLYQYNFPEKFITYGEIDLLGIAIPYIFIYLIISYTSGLLKDKLDNANDDLYLKNDELNDKNREIETQNEELNAQQDEMSNINAKLEEHVEERTHKLQEKNEALSRYGFKNAHNLRGPLARILGLLAMNKIDNSIPIEALLEMIDKEANEIDKITREIAHDLGENTEI